MSRHIIPNAPASPPGRETTVGWDAPLNTFFAMAFDSVPDSGDPGEFEDDVEVFWYGTTPGEIASIPGLALRLAEHGVELPVTVAALLADDFAGEGDQSQGRPGTSLVEALTAQAGEAG
jgi:hypothetical protein